jgi:thymidine kinase
VDLTVILGPMKSGKSLELVAQLSPLQYSTLSHTVYQSARHVRDGGVVSRVGGALETVKANDLTVALENKVDVVGIDEVHMFTRDDMRVVHELLARGTRVVAAGLDLDHRGRLFDAVLALLELGPAQVLYRRAVCDVCRDITATHTQVLEAGRPYVTELGSSRALPDDGTFTYEARCRTCVVLPDQDLPALF